MKQTPFPKLRVRVLVKTLLILFASGPMAKAQTEPILDTKNPPDSLLAAPGLTPLLQNYLSTRRIEIDALAVKYLRAIDSRLNKAADAGSLDLAKAFLGEKKQVEALQKSLSSPPDDLVTAVAQGATLSDLANNAQEGLKRLREIWTSERQKINAKLSTDIHQSLQTLERKLTKARNFTEARKIQAYRNTFAVVKSAPPVVTPNAPKTAPKPSQRMAASVSDASKDKPFENSLGMRFVPVPIAGGGPTRGKLVLFSIWETRVKDYAAFIEKNPEIDFKEVNYKQEGDHPAANVSGDDAVAFCKWLTKRDRENGKLKKEEYYRLPSDHEWSCAAGLGRKEDAEQTPKEKNYQIETFPWGNKIPPPSRSTGNYYGEETKNNPNRDPSANFTLTKLIKGYNDGFERTAPVGSFRANKYGLYDVGGNVREWCGNKPTKTKNSLVQRDSSWASGYKDMGYSDAKTGDTDSAYANLLGYMDMRSSYRNFEVSYARISDLGFRCVIVQ